jgi:hypothetical protein
MPLAILLTIVAAGMSTLLLSTVLQQTSMTKSDTGRTRAVDAASAGLEFGLGAIRASVDSSGDGLLSGLPCSTLSGAVSQGGVTFQVQIKYFLTDPRKLSSAALATSGATCPTSLGQVPRYARLVSTGIDAATKADRAVFGVYTFRTPTNVNTAGGQIHVYRKLGDPDLCVDAGASVANTVLRTQPCVTPVPNQQKFAYLKNLNFVLVSSLATSTNGLCLDAGTPEVLNAQMKLQPCGASTLSQQQWSYSPNGLIFGTDNGSTTNSMCISVVTPGTANSIIGLANGTVNSTSDGRQACDQGWQSDNRTYLPDSDVGAGAAGATSNQLVSYQAFSSCLDVPAYNVDSPTIGIYSCKQSPDPSKLEWNELFYMPAGGTGVIYTPNTATTKYCIVAPPLTDANKYIFLDPCPAAGVTPPDNMTWRVRGADAATYDEKYRIETTGTMKGYCLTIDPTVVTKQVRIAVCNGTNAQKWNAEPDLVTPSLTSIGES